MTLVPVTILLRLALPLGRIHKDIAGLRQRSLCEQRGRHQRHQKRQLEHR
jgi:hypothetical protein